MSRGIKACKMLLVSGIYFIAVGRGSENWARYSRLISMLKTCSICSVKVKKVLAENEAYVFFEPCCGHGNIVRELRDQEETSLNPEEFIQANLEKMVR